MKTIAANYSFIAAEQQIVLSDVVVPIERLLLIVNATRNQILYSLTGSGFTGQTLGTTVSQSSGNTIITLAYDTTGFSDSDKLSIFYDDGASGGSVSMDFETIDGSTPAAWLKKGGGAVPVDVQGATLNIGGNVTVSNEVEIKNDSGNSVPVLETTYKPIADIQWEIPSDSQVIDISGYPAGTIFAINIKPQASSNSTCKLMSNGSTGMYGWINEEVTAAFSSTTLTTLTTQGLYIWRKRDALTGQNHIKFACISSGNGGIARAKIFAVSNPNFGLPVLVSLAQNTLPLPSDAATETTLGAIKSAVELLDNAVSGNSIAVTGPLTDSQLRASAFEIRGSTGTLATSTGIAPENSTEILASSQSRKYLLFQNLSAAPIHLNFTNPASLSTLRIDARAALVFEGNFIPNNAINIIRTASDQSYFIAYLQ